MQPVDQKTGRTSGVSNPNGLSATWITIGGLLFTVALAAPIAIVQFDPPAGLKTDEVQSEPKIERADASDLLTPYTQPLPMKPSITERLAEGPIVPGLGAGDIRIGQPVDKLLEAIREPSELARIEHDGEPRDLHRISLEQMNLALESDPRIGRIEALHLAVNDCQHLRTFQPRQAGAPSTENGLSLGSHVSRVIGDLGIPEEGRPRAPIPGPMTQPRVQRYPGMTLHYCGEDFLIGAIEITRKPGLPVDPVTPVAALSPSALFDPQSDTAIASLTGTPGLAPPATDAGTIRAEAPNVPTVSETMVSALVELAEADGRPSYISKPEMLLALHGDAYAVMDAVESWGLGHPEDQVAMGPEPLRADTPLPGKLPYAQIALAQATESDLGLSRTKRRELQIRLGLIGFNPKGADGVFGPNTRDAISALQIAEALPVTGYLDKPVKAAIERQSRRAYRKLLRANRLARARPRTTVVVAASRVPPARNAPECARDQGGIIISNQSFSCDVTVLEESLEDLFSGTIFTEPSG